MKILALFQVSVCHVEKKMVKRARGEDRVRTLNVFAFSEPV